MSNQLPPNAEAPGPGWNPPAADSQPSAPGGPQSGGQPPDTQQPGGQPGGYGPPASGGWPPMSPAAASGSPARAWPAAAVPAGLAAQPQPALGQPGMGQPVLSVPTEHFPSVPTQPDPTQPFPSVPTQPDPAQPLPPARLAAAPDAWAPATTAPTGPVPTPLTGPRLALSQVRDEVAKAVVGQAEAVSGLLIGLLCGGHVLLEGVPGVAKTLLVRSLAASLDLEMKRVQFTPDLMPGDVTGSLIYDARAARFDFRPGPVFTNLLLADEINRTPPKTQASLLEAMEEHQVTADGTTHALPTPFMVIATQNPVEYEGTYPLPEAQLDRFLLKLTLPLPPRDDEVRVITRHAEGFDPRELGEAGLRAVTNAEDLATAQGQAQAVRVDQPVVGYVVDICRATRQAPSVSLGVSPRGATALMRTARAWAWMSGRDFVTPDDVKALAIPTLNHRIQIRTEAQMDGTTAASVISNVLATVPVPR